MKRFEVILDGVWNKPDDNTKVWRLLLMQTSENTEGSPQKSIYDRGGDTHRYNRLRGGVLASGISQNISQAFEMLIENYHHGDDIYNDPFNRAAVPANSLVGIITKCEIPKQRSPMPHLQVFEHYENRNMQIVSGPPKASILGPVQDSKIV